ncbi:MAG: Retron-type reverse transcriptase [Candidatus Kaiserbacteria bacterium GW2011_GWC2_52_8b]|uniref:Retron-type reverse transcriptase n=1 Tax=Candidatus Kaiserbacteria bacterium GW2011_GWC2_52_8b TaxID=1618676 RepID=A0A0G1XJF7_9BACT|nr:MAG: Retron-type reverse transcriptase [Candidatus Kaiserbacteria bacterium GW2011_GWC2_52_8b]
MTPPRRNSLFSFQRLYKAYLDCREHKRSTYHAAKFEEHFEAELLALEAELGNRSYKPGRSICFVVTEPVVHHLLYNFLEPIFEPKFIHASYACRTGKGTHRSLVDLKTHVRALTENGRCEAYFLHLDIRSFFMSLKKDILFGLIERRVKNPEILWLANIIIFHNPVENYFAKSGRELFAKLPPHKSLFHVPKGQGLPIGNLTSQFFANVYLNEFDQFAKHELKVKHYFRYVDDFLLLSRDKNQLLEWKRSIGLFLDERLALELNEKKQIMQEVSKGIDWLGYIVKPDHVAIRRRIIRNFKRKLYMFDRAFGSEQKPSQETLAGMCASVNSYFGHFSHADTFKLRTHLWEAHFGALKKYIEPADERLVVVHPKSETVQKSGRAGS